MSGFYFTESTMVKCKGSANSRKTFVAQAQIPANNVSAGELTPKMDQILGMIQGYEGKTDTAVEMMLDMQKKFEERLEALRLENDAIKVQINQCGEQPEQEDNTNKIEREQKRLQQNDEIGESSEQVLKETEERTKSIRHEFSYTANSHTTEKKKDQAHHKKIPRIRSEGLPSKAKSAENTTTGVLDERLIEEVAKRIEGIRTHYPTKQAAATMRGITRFLFVSWIEREESQEILIHRCWRDTKEVETRWHIYSSSSRECRWKRFQRHLVANSLRRH